METTKNGLVSEAITTQFAEWYDESRIKPPDYILKRLDDKKGNRFYYETEPFETRAGITSLLQKVLPPSYALTEWNKKYGDKASYMLNVSSRFGTSEHRVNKAWMVDRAVDEEQIQVGIECCKEYGASEDMPYKDLVVFMKFCEDYNIKPLLCEAMLKAKFNGQHYALTLDLLCEMTFTEKKTEMVKEEKFRNVVTEVPDGFFKSGKKAGMPKMKKVTTKESYFVEKEVTVKKEITRLALVDFKSNFFEKTDKGFYEAHLYQLLAAKEAVKQNFGLDVEVLINYAPNAWRTEPSYSMKQWKPEEIDYLIFNNLLEQARLRGYFSPQGSIFVTMPITGETKSTEAYKFMTYEEYAKFKEGIVEVVPVEPKKELA